MKTSRTRFLADYIAHRSHTELVAAAIVGPVTSFIVNYSPNLGFGVRRAHFDAMIQRTIRRRRPRKKFVTAG